MNSVGIICEYNPFHKGHLHHLNQVKKLYSNHTIILVLSTHFTQRGNTSILNKWDKTKIALHYGVDIVIELPFTFSTQNADKFSHGGVSILNHMQVGKLVFGSESNNLNTLKELAAKQINTPIKNNIKKYLKQGFSYPKSLYNAYKDNNLEMSSTPNDILGITYIKEIIKNNYNIEPITIQRTNDYHSNNTDEEIISATAARKLLKENKSVTKYLPNETTKYLKNYKDTDNKYFELLKYKIVSTNAINLEKIQDVDEGLENRLKKYINESNTLEEFINKIKTKRYTRNKITRMFTHILVNYTKEENIKNKDITYIRILGISKQGQKYLNKIKKELDVPILTNYKNIKDEILQTELKATKIYGLLNNTNYIKLETNKNIIK